MKKTKYILKKLELSSEQLEGKADIDFPLVGIPLTLSAGTLFYLESKPEPSHMGFCQAVSCGEHAVASKRFEWFVVNVCEKHEKEFFGKEE